MTTEIFISCFLGMLFLQTVHIFEEIGMRAYELVGSLEKYLKVASLLVFAGYLPLVLILLGVQTGYYLAFFSVVLAVGNGLIHLVGYFKTRSYRGTLGAGVFSGVPLGIMGIIVLFGLIQRVM